MLNPQTAENVGLSPLVIPTQEQFFSRLLKDEARQQLLLLDPAHHLYLGFWGKPLDEIVQPVPNHPKFGHFTEETILPLKMFLYREKTLLIREEYKILYDTLRSYKKVETAGGVVIAGQPGIGKSCFLYYLLLRLLCDQQPVAFQVNKRFVLFQGTGVSIGDYEAVTSMPPGTWCLSDSHSHFKQPCATFLAECASGNAWVVQTTSPSRSNWAQWSKDHFAFVHWMKVTTLDEMMALGLNLEELPKIYDEWGPSARNCISFLAHEGFLQTHIGQVTAAAADFTRKFTQYDNIEKALSVASRQLFVVEPTEESRHRETLRFASEHILGLVARAYATHDHVVRQTFYKTASGHAWYGASVGRIFRTSALLWLRYPPINDSLQCFPASGMVRPPELEIPACREKMEFFSKVDELKNVDEHESLLCLVPVLQTFPTLDAIIITTDSVISIQMTVAGRHDAKMIGLWKVYNAFTPEFRHKKRNRFHVFLTDTEDKAQSLRTQKVKDEVATEGIHLYSAFIKFEVLDSIITVERFNDLETKREGATQVVMNSNEDHMGVPNPPPRKKQRTDTEPECASADEGTSSKGLITDTDREDERRDSDEGMLGIF